MTTTTEHTADQLLKLSREVQALESALTYTAGVITSMAADDQTNSPIFESSVAQYKQLRTDHAEAKNAYNALLN